MAPIRAVQSKERSVRGPVSSANPSRNASSSLKYTLIQVEPVNVVSLCDVDQKMLSDAADIVASRQRSKKRPRTYTDYREMLAEKDLDIVLIGTPDHWHALNMIEACQAGADIYCQKPISVDVVEGQAMLKAARKYERVVQIGTQRRSTPHLIEARDRVIKEGLLGNPEMFIRGNGSSRTVLRWFQPRGGSELPMPCVVSVSVWFYRLLMLAWALWLAVALIRWLKWAWTQFSDGGCWRRSPKKAKVPPPIPGTKG